LNESARPDRITRTRVLGEIVTYNWVLVFHIFGVILWMGSLLVISSMMALLPEEVGAARERIVVIARRLFHVSSNIGAIVAVVFGLFIILLNPAIMLQGWMHAKIALVLVLLVFHVRLYWRVTALESDPGSATRREFTILHGIFSLLLLLILVLVLVKPF
jgi:putative membrane protein